MRQSKQCGMWFQVVESLRRLVVATACSLAGLKFAARHEHAFRQELGVLLLVIPAGLWLGNNGVERALLIGSWLLVMVIEIVNSAIETVIDRVGQEHNDLSARAKDLGSAAVFVAIGAAVVVWFMILTGR